MGTKFPLGPYLIALAIIVLAALFPAISVLIVSLIADAHGCQVNESSINPCIVMGQDLGGLLVFMGILGWLMLITLPFGFVALCIWLLVLVGHILVRYVRANRSEG